MSEEYSLMSPNTLEAQGLINQNEYQKVVALTHSASPDAQKKLAGKFTTTYPNWLGSSWPQLLC